jgi:hypothetical protein
MGKVAKCNTDNLKQDTPHCHAPIHPPAPVPTPVPHPGLPLLITGPGAATVKVEKMNAAIMMDQSMPCMLPSCVPGGPGMIMKVSMTVMATKKGMARAQDMSTHTSCVAPIPSPVGKVMPPGAGTVEAGG